MRDLAKRPRGGWQFGTRPKDKRGSRPRDDHGRLLLPDGRVDPDPSCYSVRRTAPGVFQIGHYLDPDDGMPCCWMEIAQSPRDREVAQAEGIDVDIITLRRAPDCVRQRRKAMTA